MVEVVVTSSQAMAVAREPFFWYTIFVEWYLGEAW